MGKPQVLVMFSKGDHAFFDIEGKEYFDCIEMELEKSLYEWISIGCNAILRKDEISRLFYFAEGMLNANTINEAKL